MTENAFINMKNRSYTITAPVELRDAQHQRRDHCAGWQRSAAGRST